MYKPGRKTRLIALLFLLLPAYTGIVYAQNVDSFPTQDAPVMEVEEQLENGILYFDTLTTDEEAPVELRQADRRKVDDLKSQDAFWYADKAPKRKKLAEPKDEKSKGGFFTGRWFVIFLWVVIIGSFLAVLIWFLLTSNVRIFERKKRVIREAATETPEENIFDIDYNNEIAKAIALSDYRMAVRLLYLQLLSHMSNANVIQYKQENTNSAYLRQLEGSTLYTSFSDLTRAFEYAWYGRFIISEGAFGAIRDNFAHFTKRLSS